MRKQLLFMDYSTENLIRNLLKNQSFVTWVLKSDPELDQYWNDWCKGDYTKKTASDQARLILLSSEHKIAGITDKHIAEKVNQALKIAKKRESSTHLGDHVFSFLRAYWVTAASVVLMLSIGLGIYKTYAHRSVFTENKKQLSFSDEIIEIVNADKPVKYVQLPDGSSVVLQTNSRISFARQFDPKKRVVVLSGEAFFEVTKDPERPFFVYANELVTKVLGTSFSIKADENASNVLVLVKTGKVSVFSNNDRYAEEYKRGNKLSALLLSPNQQATFERNQATLGKSTLKESALLKIPIEKQGFVYDATPVSTVFSSLELAYGIDIEYNEQTMKDCSVTATLGDEPLDKKLKWICTILEAAYQINGDKVNIKGNSCN